MWEQIRYNQTRTAQLVIGIGLLLLLLGFLLGLLFSLGLKLMFLLTPKDELLWPLNLLGPLKFGIFGVIVALTVWVVASLVAYFRGDNIILALSKAKKIGADDLHRLYNIVEELKISSGLDMIPSIYIIDDAALNAFAVGRNPNKAAVIVTSGLLTKLNRDELQGVIGHEIAHIKNRDVLLMVMCSVLLGTMIILSYYPRYLSWSETTITEREPSRKKYSDRTNLRKVFFSIFIAWVVFLTLPSENSISFAMLIIFPFLSLALTPLTMGVLIGLPFTVLSIYYAISRRREYLADAYSALYTRYPEGLASALEKIAASTDQLQSATPTLAPIYIANPFGRRSSAKDNSTSTHPPISERIRILRLMTHISLVDYDRAYREVRGTDRNVLPAYALANAVTAAIRSAVPEDLNYIQRRRETSNVLWNLNNYKIINCACGTKLRLPPTYKLPEVRCPHCGRINPV